MEDSKQSLLKEIQIAKFAKIEANLFLDTHPNDQEALKYYEKTCDKLEDLEEEWKKRYGEIKVSDGMMRWAWVENPWPWEKGV